ncbi:unnamed protein product [Bursaphelenchus okinawaensis]|uniref:MFS domain-containing protein n=1 Tax=Bursaphelenchus okinawaensis TaxID=465554 RepID=A0A811K901_9BILA|nr:unnamed protein product [Bursaphelenchus okinawaensis]CAG9094570.1 unnamed protein product [Bursaphelenchus okinawaensis]
MRQSENNIGFHLVLEWKGGVTGLGGIVYENNSAAFRRPCGGVLDCFCPPLPPRRGAGNLTAERTKRELQNNARWEKGTTAHPLENKSGFLATEATEKPDTRRTRRPYKSRNRQPTILTNPAVQTTVSSTVTTTEATTTTVATSTVVTSKRETPKPTEVVDSRKSVLIGVEDDRTSNDGLKTSDSEALHDGAKNSEDSGLFDRDWLELATEMLLFSAPGLGMLIAFWPLTLLFKYQGSRVIIGFCLLASTLLLLLQPSLLHSGIWMVIALRLIQGATCAATLSVIGRNAANWATLKEQLLFVSISFGAILFSPGIYWLLTIRILNGSNDHIGLLHYFFSASTFIVALLWILFYRDDPQDHRWVNGIELNRILTGKAQQQNRLLKANVTRLLLKSYSTWSVLVATFAYFSAVVFFATFLPIYFLKVLKFEKLCSLTSVTFLAPTFVHLFSVIFDKLLSGCSSKLKANFFNSFAFVVTAVFLFVLAAVPPNEHFAYNSKWLLMVSIMPLGFTSLGFLYHTVIYGRFFTQYIISLFQVPIGLALTIVPSMVLLLTVNNEVKFWRLSMIVLSALLVLGALVFGVLSRGQPARWAEHSWDPANDYKMKDINPILGTEECGLLSVRKVEEVPNDSTC